MSTKEEIERLIVELNRAVHCSPEKAELRDVCILISQSNLLSVNILKALTDIREKLR